MLCGTSYFKISLTCTIDIHLIILDFGFSFQFHMGNASNLPDKREQNWRGKSKISATSQPSLRRNGLESYSGNAFHIQTQMEQFVQIARVIVEQSPRCVIGRQAGYPLEEKLFTLNASAMQTPSSQQ